MYHGSQTVVCEVNLIINHLSARYQLVIQIFNIHSFTIYLTMCTFVISKQHTPIFFNKK